MKGLFLKDLYVMKKYHIFPLLMLVAVGLVIMTIMGYRFYADDNYVSGLYLYAVFFVNMIPIGIVYSDEQSKWIDYCCAMPVSRKKYISSKYILNIFLNIFIMAVISVPKIINISHRYRITREYTINETVFTLMVVLSVGLLAFLLAFPLNIRFHTRKSFVISMLTGIILTVAGVVTGCEQFSFYPVRNIISWDISVLILMAVMILYIISWWLSVRIFQNKQL